MRLPIRFDPWLSQVTRVFMLAILYVLFRVTIISTLCVSRPIGEGFILSTMLEISCILIELIKIGKL